MNFTELENIMLSNGIVTLADIARNLQSTPQAVSNWKARDQVPYHIVLKLRQYQSSQPEESIREKITSPKPIPGIITDPPITFSDILLTLAEQIKIILLTAFLSVFIAFTHTQFVKVPLFMSTAKILLPENKSDNIGGIAGLASQFGVSMPSNRSVDLSSPSLFPELLRSRTLAEKILEKEFYSNKHEKKLPLLAIFTHGDGPPASGKDTLITSAKGILDSMIELEKSPTSSFSVLTVIADDPVFAKRLAEVVIQELEDLNRYFKSQSVNDKTTFIEQRINNVKIDLELSEQSLKDFNEQNRQISTPSLLLKQERLERNVEVQKGIYLTLKQQLELAKIEEVQEASIVQILDFPQAPLGPFNRNLKLTIVVSFVVGTGLGIILGFIRSYLIQQDNIDERRKLRRVKTYLKKKGKDIILDRRIFGIISIALTVGLPFYLGHQSTNPVFFGRFSSTMMLINSIYVTTLIISLLFFFRLSNKSKA